MGGGKEEGGERERGREHSTLIYVHVDGVKVLWCSSYSLAAIKNAKAPSKP